MIIYSLIESSKIVNKLPGVSEKPHAENAQKRHQMHVASYWTYVSNKLVFS